MGRTGIITCVVLVGCLLGQAVRPVSAQEVDTEAVRLATERGLAAIQRAQATWYTDNKQVCASCHHQYQPALAFRAAREHGVPVDESRAGADAARAFSVADLDRAVQYSYVIEPAMDDAYRMVAAHAAGVAPSLAAAVYARLLISRQNAAGDWDGFHQRPPSSYSRVTMAALGLRAVQAYRHPTQALAAEAAVARARRFLEDAVPRDTEERAYQLLGLRWAGADRGTLQRLARSLKETQREDGGWSSVAGRPSDAYSTGQALVALHDGASVANLDRSYRRGVEFLLDAQAADGTWHVRSRLHAPAPVSPPYFDAGYPYGHDQFISMQGASWAVMALAYALDPIVAPLVPDPGASPGEVEPWAETMLFGTVDDVRRLLDEGLSPDAATEAGGTTALMMAAPDVEKMRLLLDRGADVDARARSRFTALMVAAQYQDGGPAIDLLLDRGAAARAETPPVFGASPFFLAAYAGNAGSLPRLLEAGGTLDGAMSLIGTSRTTPMLGAAKFGDLDVVRMLLDLGVPVDEADGNGTTMLARAVLNNDVGLARLLLDRGASANPPQDARGMTPLLWAANVDFGDDAMVRLLLAAGARTDVRTPDGLTPLALARRHGHVNLIPALEQAAAAP